MSKVSRFSFSLNNEQTKHYFFLILKLFGKVEMNVIGQNVIWAKVF
jgi:hypothetical protein